MRHRCLAVLGLSLLLAHCVQAADAPPPVPNTPEGVVQQLMAVLVKDMGLRQDNQAIEQDLAPLVVQVPDPEGPEVPWDFALYFTWGQALAGAQTLPQPTVEGGRTTVDIQPPPIHLVLVQVDGKWKVDAEATYKLLPAAARKFAEDDVAASEAARQPASPPVAGAPKSGTPGAGLPL